MVSDTVIGPNLRISDNLFQLAVIVACILVFAPIGAFVAAQSASPESRNGAMVGGALAGTLAALILGVLGIHFPNMTLEIRAVEGLAYGSI